MTAAELDRVLLDLVTQQDNEQDNVERLHASVLPLFDVWCQRHNKDNNNNNKKEHRLSVFVANARAVAAHNEAYRSGWTLYAQTIFGSPFADVADEEFAATHLMESQNCSATMKTQNTKSLRE